VQGNFYPGRLHPNGAAFGRLVGARRRRAVSVLESDLLLLQLSVQGVSVDAQQVGGTTQVSTGRRQRSLDAVTLEDVEWLKRATATRSPTIDGPAIVRCASIDAT
jgi:hypothetical protein